MSKEKFWLLFLVSFFLANVESTKWRSWLGQNTFVDGTSPAGRKGGQIMTTLNEKLYLFGGAEGSGYLNDLHIYYIKSRTWVDVTDKVQGIPPSPRQGHAFKAQEGKLYLFGGVSTTAYLNDLFVFNPLDLSWTEITSSISGAAPSPRAGSTLASVSGRFYTFGGWDMGTLHFFNDLFVLDPTALLWTNLTERMSGDIPLPLTGPGVAVLGDIIYLFGGSFNDNGKMGYSNRLFTFDTAHLFWRDITPAAQSASPPSRVAAGFAALDGRLWLFGGLGSAATVRADLWTFDPAEFNGTGGNRGTWSDRTNVAAGSRPSARAGLCMVAAAGQLYSFGGYTDWPVTYLNSLMSITPTPAGAAPPTWTDLTNQATGLLSPATTTTSSAVEAGSMVTTVVTTERLIQLNPRAAYHGLAAVGGVIFMFGGSRSTGDFSADLHRWDENTLAWTNITLAAQAGGSVPPAREHHGFVATGDGRLYVHGGLGYGGLLSDMYRLDPVKLSWTNMNLSSVNFDGPSARKGHGLASLGMLLFVYGGYGNSGVLGDLWCYNLTLNTWSDLSTASSETSPQPRAFHALAGLGGLLYAFGGQSGSAVLDDLQRWDPSTGKWVLISATSTAARNLSKSTGAAPTPRVFHTMTAHLGRLFVFGGWSEAGLTNDLFSFSPGSMTWTSLSEQILGNPPTARYGHTVASTGKFLYLCGGINLPGDYLEDMHTLPIPRTVGWPDNAEFLAGFLDIYDWDICTLTAASYANLPVPLQLCTRGTPCALSVEGDAADLQPILVREPYGAIICKTQQGCEYLVLRNIAVSCGAVGAAMAPVLVDGSQLVVQESLFLGCRALTHGGAIEALEATVRISSTVFSGAASGGSGGAVSLVGSTAELLGVIFINCTADGDGGALSTTNYQCTRSLQIPSITRIVDSSFENCRAIRGGALSVVSGAVAVRMASFNSNSARVSGGAVFVSGWVEGLALDIIDANFYNNSAGGMGGGAVLLENVSARLADLNGTRNSASKGGGGVVMWIETAPEFVCGPGSVSVSSGREIVCLVCPAGTYQSGIGMQDTSDCRSCRPGSFSFLTGATFCVFCGAGTYSSSTGASSVLECLACASGTFQTGVGLTGPSECYQCAAGSYGSSGGASVCTTCAAGSFSTAVGMASGRCYAICAAGTYSSAGSSYCSKCDRGKYSTVIGAAALSASMALCGLCVGGTYTNTLGASTCRSCNAGTYSREGATECVACLPGSFSPVTKSSRCILCDAGISYSGATSCTACPSGTNNSAVQSTSLLCQSSDKNGLLCGLNTKCYDSHCFQGTIGRLIPGEAYDNDESIMYTIVAPPGASIILKFTFLQTEPLYDVVKVYSCSNMSCIKPKRLGSFSGTIALPDTPVAATTGVMLVVWDGTDVCCPKPSVVCSCDNPANTFLLTGWAAEFTIITSSNCSKGSAGPAANDTQTRRNSISVPLTEEEADEEPYDDSAQSKIKLAFDFGLADLRKSYRSISPEARIKSLNASDSRYPTSRVLVHRDLTEGLEPSIGEYSALPQGAVGGKGPSTSIFRYDILGNSKGSASINKELRTEHMQGVESRRISSKITGEKIRAAMCGSGNIAAYGNCVASAFARLHVQDLPVADSQQFAGIPFSLRVLKQDAYNQTIISDSASVLQLYSSSALENGVSSGTHEALSATILGAAIVRLVDGVADFSIALKPLFNGMQSRSQGTIVYQPRIYFYGLDSTTGVEMMSSVNTVNMSSGSSVCPRGYILNLEPPVQIGSKAVRPATCTFCEAGTYSVYPLASAAGMKNASDPECVPCPQQASQNGDCAKGGADVHFSLGTWKILDGVYSLIGCPVGYQLVNSVDGLFSNQAQRCQLCSQNQYLLDSNNPAITCQPCSPLAQCNGSDFSIILPGTEWKVVSGKYILTGCPAGYELLIADEDCGICPALFFCPGSSESRIACPDNFFSPPGSKASSECETAVFVHFSITLAMTKSSLTKDKQQLFLKAVAAAGRTLPSQVVIDSVQTAQRTSAVSVKIIVRIAAADQGQAEILAKNIDAVSLNEQFESNDLPFGILSGLRVGDDSNVVLNVLSPGATAGIAVGGAVTLLSLVLVVLIWLGNRRFESGEEKILRLKVIQLRQLLGLRRKDGFVLTTESIPFGRRRDRTVFILSREIEAAARLALHMDFDVRSFDAFCHCIEYSPFTLFKGSSAPAVVVSPHYSALCDWLLDLCCVLIEPPTLKLSHSASSLRSSNASGLEDGMLEFNGLDNKIHGIDARERFMYFRRTVLRCRIWHNHNQGLFRRLKAAASCYMDQIAHLCDKRFETLSREPYASELLDFGGSNSAGRRLSLCKRTKSTSTPASDETKDQLPSILYQSRDNSTGAQDAQETLIDFDTVIHRQDHGQVRAIIVYDEARREAYLEGRDFQQLNLKQSGDEEVFIAQLHRRARLLCEGFQKTVIEVVAAHEATNSRECAQPDFQKPSIGWSDNSEISERSHDINSNSYHLIDSLDQQPKDFRALQIDDKADVTELRLGAEHNESEKISKLRATNIINLGKVFPVVEQSENSKVEKKTQDPFESTGMDTSTLSSNVYNRIRQAWYGASESLTEGGGPCSIPIACHFSEGIGVLEVHIGAVKTVSRMREKLSEYASEGASWPLVGNILDPVRLSLVCNGPSQMVQAANWLTGLAGCSGCLDSRHNQAFAKSSSYDSCPAKAESLLRVVRVKNKFSFSPDELHGGYRDLMLSVLYQDADSGLRIIGEIQIHDAELFDLKRQVVTH